MKAIIAIIATAGLCVFFTAVALQQRKVRRRFFEWEPMEAEIISKSVKPLDHRHVEAASEFAAVVTYRYRVNGKEYISHQLYFEGREFFAGKSGLKNVERFLATLPVTMRGRFNPRQPAKAALFPPDLAFYLGPMLGSIFLALFALFQFLLYLAE